MFFCGLLKNTTWALDILKKVGFLYDASANPLSHCSGREFGLYINKDLPILEFPLSTLRCLWERLPFTGGLPLRINPYFFIIESTLDINKAGHPAIFYIHPWEFDSEQIKIPLPFSKKIMHYFNIKVVPSKIELLLQRFEFASIEEALGIKKVHDKKRKLMPLVDKYYIKSLLASTLFCSLLVIIIMSIGCIIGWYVFILIIIMLGIWYI